MKYFANTASKEELKAMSISPTSASPSDTSYNDLKHAVENPLEKIMVKCVNAEVEQLINLDFAVFYTNHLPTFITSNNPCVWHDPKAYKRPLFQ